jgi:hypothetical protein
MMKNFVNREEDGSEGERSADARCKKFICIFKSFLFNSLNFFCG